MIKIGWRSPSNIALIKYWGKKNLQEPLNPSFSMTLKESYTDTILQVTDPQENRKPGFELFFEGKPASMDFVNKTERYLQIVEAGYPFLNTSFLKIESVNSFPHSAGIASSASSMSALALCLESILALMSSQAPDEIDLQKVSALARLGSGSACRSVFPGFVLWGKHSSLPFSSDDYAVPLNDRIHDVFREWGDAILVVSKEKKPVGSSEGHALMNNHFYLDGRIKQANANLKELLIALETGDEKEFVRIVENEALSLHALMMSSNPSYILLKQESLAIIKEIEAFRRKSNIPVCFTIDAGPNIHLLYPLKERNRIQLFVENDLLKYCESRCWIDDKIGFGPHLIKE